MLLRGARVGKGSVKREGLLREGQVSDGGFVRTAGLHEDMKPQFGERGPGTGWGRGGGSGSVGGLGLTGRGAVGKKGLRREGDSDRMS